MLLTGRLQKDGAFSIEYDPETLGEGDWVTVICKQHGPFWVDAIAHVRGEGCPVCESEGR